MHSTESSGRLEPSHSAATDWSFHVTPWERVFLRKINTAQHSIRLACPFIKLRNTRLVLASVSSSLRSPIRLQVLTRLNFRDCKSAVHDLAALQLLLDNPISQRCIVELRVDNSLHAKLYIFDDSEAIVTSSNLTYAGFYRNREVALSTSVAGTVQSAVTHFADLFANAAAVTTEVLADMRYRLRSTAPTSVAFCGDAFDEESDQHSEESTDDVPLDQSAIEAVEASVAERLAEDLVTGVLTVDRGTSSPSPVDKLSENRFYEDLSLHFQHVVGTPVPPVDDLATIYVHPSAHGNVSVGKPNPFHARALEEIGKRVYEAVIALLVFEQSSDRTNGDDISTKVQYIYRSDHLVSQLNALGLMRVIVASSLAESDTESAAHKRAVARMSSLVALKLVAYLFLNRPWNEFLARCRALLRLSEDFPFETYRHEDFKSRLQAVCQESYGTPPKYDLISEEGPDHDKWFTVIVAGGQKHHKRLGKGRGRTRKQAEINAAYEALSNMSATQTLVVRPSASAELPRWIHDFCEHNGAKILSRVCGKSLGNSECEAILIPFKHDVLSTQCDSPGLSDTGGGRIMAPQGGSKDERIQVRDVVQAAAIF
jgi:ribonuclease-3